MAEKYLLMPGRVHESAVIARIRAAACHSVDTANAKLFAIVQGTSSTRALLFDEAMQPLAIEHERYRSTIRAIAGSSLGVRR
jgi:hypothetical protein